MNDLREDIGMQLSLTGRAVRSRVVCAGHSVRMEENRIHKKAEAMKQPGRRNRGRPQLKREDCVKMNARHAEDDDK